MNDALPLFDMPAAPAKRADEGSKGRAKPPARIRWVKYTGSHRPCDRCVAGKHAAEVDARAAGATAAEAARRVSATTVRSAALLRTSAEGKRSYWCKGHGDLVREIEAAAEGAGFAA